VNAVDKLQFELFWKKAKPRPKRHDSCGGRSSYLSLTRA
jgi:hypothetical protein